jgi:Kef-type K+ transport system membrane component KefB
LVPFAGATVLIPYLMARGDLFATGTSPALAWLFVGASISITAFPMLARILHEHGLANSRLGALTLAAGSIDDAIAWCLLALVLALFQKNPLAALITIGGGIAYGAFMLTLGRKLLRSFEHAFERAGQLTMEIFTSVLIVLMICAWLTDRLGIYAAFGAFVLGVAMPAGRLSLALTHRIEQLTTALLVPIFFVYSGLNTRIGLVNTTALWEVTLLVVLVSILGKGVACMAAARWSGESWYHSAIIGTLMNARGLMELILLNIGLEQGLITPTYFAIMVIMAVVTTGMCSPLYHVLSRQFVATTPVGEHTVAASQPNRTGSICNPLQLCAGCREPVERLTA